MLTFVTRLGLGLTALITGLTIWHVSQSSQSKGWAVLLVHLYILRYFVQRVRGKEGWLASQSVSDATLPSMRVFCDVMAVLCLSIASFATWL